VMEDLYMSGIDIERGRGTFDYGSRVAPLT
jgi:hypothetical protein